MKLVFVVGDSGGDYFAIEQANKNNLIKTEIVKVLTNSINSKALSYHLTNYSSQDIFVEKNKEEFFHKSIEILKKVEFDYIILSGFKYILPDYFVKEYEDKILNSHHSVLPSHPGLFLKEMLVQSDDLFLGATIHFVDKGVDTGKKISQATFPNYGMNKFDDILKLYRFVQDVLIVDTIKKLMKHENKKESVRYYNEILFNPKVDIEIIEYFWRVNFG
ncbi:formyltransferase family protein [Lysinibacillus capsici]|uniref:formyltransferase family protein n=1 Tax=Lysinibacillus capsici TaxID=2115968 RepID=UPI0034E5A777